MSLVTESALADMLKDIVRDACTMRLYVNDIGDNPTAADFVEPIGGGYIGKPMREAGWNFERAPQEAIYQRQTWTFEGPVGIVQGYFVTRNSDGRLRWFEPLKGGPMRIVNNGDEISVTPSLEFGAKPDEKAEEAGEA